MKISKFLNTNKSKLFWLYIVLGALVSLAGLILAPFWIKISKDIFFANWGYSAISFVIAILIMFYVCAFLIKKIVQKGGNKVVKILTICEAVLLVFIAVSAVLNQFNVQILYISNAGQILGLALWLRGAVEVFNVYYYKNEEGAKYSVWQLVLAIVFISLGVALVVKNFLSNEAILWVIVSVLLVIGITLITLGVVKKPKKAVVKKAKQVPVEESENK